VLATDTVKHVLVLSGATFTDIATPGRSLPSAATRMQLAIAAQRSPHAVVAPSVSRPAIDVASVLAAHAGSCGSLANFDIS
jgi:hypothetical protein